MLPAPRPDGSQRLATAGWALERYPNSYLCPSYQPDDHEPVTKWTGGWACKPAWAATIKYRKLDGFSSVQFSHSAVSNSLRPMNHSTPGLPVHHQLPELTQTHVHWVGDAVQPSHPLSSPSPPAPNPSQHQGLFQWFNSLHEVAKVLEFQLQHQFFQWIPRTDLL